MTISCISELFSDKSNTHEFVDLVKELALPGELTQNRSYDFEFMQVEKPYESYVGANVRLRYFCCTPLRSNILVCFWFHVFTSQFLLIRFQHTISRVANRNEISRKDIDKQTLHDRCSLNKKI